MSISRYSQTPRLNLGMMYGTSETVARIRAGIRTGKIATEIIFLKEAIRLDVLAGQYYNNAQYYWLIAAASNIGWTPQIPPNTRIAIPNLQQALRFLG
jgi:hypothetical protein